MKLSVSEFQPCQRKRARKGHQKAEDLGKYHDNNRIFIHTSKWQNSQRIFKIVPVQLLRQCKRLIHNLSICLKGQHHQPKKRNHKYCRNYNSKNGQHCRSGLLFLLFIHHGRLLLLSDLFSRDIEVDDRKQGGNQECHRCNTHTIPIPR